MKAWANDDSDDIKEDDEPKQPIEPEVEEMEVSVRAPRTRSESFAKESTFLPQVNKTRWMLQPIETLQCRYLKT